ncbi:MAG TPA: M28 family peptidase [Pyrinomonadaceae bacterium]
MKRITFSWLLLITLFGSTFAQTTRPSDVEQNLRTHVQYLASQKLEGRRTGEQGATFAAGYVANQFAKFKLKPGHRSNGSKATFLQPFPYVAGVQLGADNFLRIIPGDITREQKMEIGINWMPLGYSMSADIPPADLVFAGFGITAPEANYDDYKGLDVKDKIVLMFDSTPDTGNPHSAFARFNIHTKANIAKDKGAKAIVLIATDPDFKNDRLSRLAYDRTFGETALPVVGIMRSHGAELLGVKDDLELQAIEKQQAETRAVARVFPKATAQLKVNLVKKQVDAYNVIGYLEGTDPQLKNEAIIIGAHYDHLGRGGSSSLAANSTEIHYGADDNASGTSAILELARLFAKEKKNKRTLIFMAFGGEEEGLLGSKHYVNNPAWPLEKTIAMINLDMVGRLNENKLTVGGVGTASEWRGLVEGENLGFLGGVPPASIIGPVGRAGTASEGSTESKVIHRERLWRIPPRFALQLNEDGFGPSDHSSFYGKQIPVLFFFTGTHTDYHKPSDTFEKINYEGLTNITNYVGEIARAIDQNPTKPTYAVAKTSGQMGQVRMSVSLGTIPSYADSTDGMVLDGVRENSPAAKAGLKAGDKVVKLAGKDVRNAMDYTYVLSSMKPGEEYEVELIRGTERMTLKVVPAAPARRP